MGFGVIAASYTGVAELSGSMAAFSFNEGSGSTAADSSGNGNDAVLSNASWDPSGHTGAGLTNPLRILALKLTFSHQTQRLRSWDG